ncbi:MAG: type II toxin-antitoxin system VapC family toxin [Acidobacteriota bacterium]|nr:MAG: type II toxin-antitoxin system VapC family toxin [Acidobacteriota bacterium]
MASEQGGACPSAFTALVEAPRLIGKAFKIACELNHPVYDCLYLALAEIEKCELVMADRKFLRKVSATLWEKFVEPL